MSKFQSRVESKILSEVARDVDDLINNPPPEGLINHIKESDEANEVDKAGQFSMRFQILVTLFVVLSALSGAFLGGILSEIKAGEVAVTWIALPGDLFIRSLTCIVLPLVFVNVILAVIQMAEAGKAGTVGVLTIVLYLTTTALAALEGLIAVLLFKGRFSTKVADPDDTFMVFGCGQKDFGFVQEGREIFCKNLTEATPEATRFEINNPNDFFVIAEGEVEEISFSETLQDGIFRKMISRNLVQEFADGGFVGVVMFGVLFGAASQKLSRKPVLIVKFLEDVNDILVRMVEWVIYLTPIAIFSLIAGALAEQEDLQTTMKDLGILVGTVVTGEIIHAFVTLPAIFYFFVRENPYEYLKFIIPAQVFAFSCASSAATLPVTLKCVKESGKVPDSIRDFVLPIGATINMDGTALYFPAALIFLATAEGTDTGPAEYFLIIIVATIGSAGAAPVPNAALVLLLTAYNTVYGVSAPENFGILFGVEWLVERFQTSVNVTGDAIVARIVTKLAGLDVAVDEPTSRLAPSRTEAREEHLASREIISQANVEAVASTGRGSAFVSTGKTGKGSMVI